MRFYQYSILYVILIILFFAQYGFASVQEETAAWVVRWHIDSPAEIHSICSEAKGKYNTLLVQVRGRADAYYSSNLVPRAEELAGQQEEFDPLSTILSQCSENKIQAWINVFYLWTGEIPPESPQHPARVANSWIIKDNNGKSVSEYSPLTQAQGWIEGIYADPSSPDYRVYLLDIVKEIIGKYPIEGIHLDFIRYPGLSYGYDSNLAGQFSDTYGFDPKWLPDSINHHMIAAWLDGSMVL